MKKDSTKNVEGEFHQIDSDISFPTDPELLLNVMSKDQIEQVINHLGDDTLKDLASREHGGENIDYAKAAEVEGKDLQTVRNVLAEVMGCEKPWIMGFASDFAKCLQTFA